MAKRTFDERIEELVKKQEQLKAQERQLKKRQNAEERKRLIIPGDQPMR